MREHKMENKKEIRIILKESDYLKLKKFKDKFSLTWKDLLIGSN